jgi:hypothetical protein
LTLLGILSAGVPALAPTGTAAATAAAAHPRRTDHGFVSGAEYGEAHIEIRPLTQRSASSSTSEFKRLYR